MIVAIMPMMPRMRATRASDVIARDEVEEVGEQGVGKAAVVFDLS